jgi:hypothetical protein
MVGVLEMKTKTQCAAANTLAGAELTASGGSAVSNRMKALLIFTAILLVVSAAIARPARRFVSLEERLMKRAEKILIPRVDFQDTTVADALEFLENEGQAHDPKHEGIAIEVQVEPWQMVEYIPGSRTEKPAPPGGWPLFEPLKQRVTLSLHNISLAEALRYATGPAICKVRSSRTALTLVPITMAVDPLVTHTIPLAGAPKAQLQKMRANPKQYFSECGVIFREDDDRAGCFFEDNGTTLVVTNTGAQIDLVHALLETLEPYEPPKKADYRYTVWWNRWSGDSADEEERWKYMDVCVNGDYIGTRESAFRLLEFLPAKAGEHVKLDMPSRPVSGRQAPGHWESNFIQRWLEKGAFVDWYEDGKKYKLHTVTWAGSLQGNLRYVEKMDDLTWIVDGKKIGKRKNLLPLIQEWKKTKEDLVIQIVIPIECKPRFFKAQPEYFQFLDGMEDGEKIRVYRIKPFRESRPEPKPETPRIPGLPPVEEIDE